MKEKILALLIAKFSGVRKDGLQQLARSMALQAADEAAAQALVDAISDTQVTEFVKDWRAEVDSETTKAIKANEDKLKSKFNFVEKKGEPTPPAPDDAPAWAKTIIDDNKTLKEELAALKSGKTTDVRKTKLEEALKDAAPKFKETIVRQFGRMSFATDEEFDAFVAETQTDAKEFVQQSANSGLGAHGKPFTAGGNVSEKAVGDDIKAWAEKNKPTEK